MCGPATEPWSRRSSGVAPQGIRLSKDAFRVLLEDLLAWVDADDTMEGSLAYEVDGPTDYRVQCGLRFGNSMGQGSVRVLNGNLWYSGPR